MMHTTETRPMLEVENVVHRYGTVTALADVSLSAGRGEFLTILGLFRVGQDNAAACHIRAGAANVGQGAADRRSGCRRSAAAKRNCTTVFQSYALFPHMTVVENVAYGLRIRARSTMPMP